MLLTEEERERVKGLIINKFRGDSTILDPGIQMLTERGQVPVLGTVPYMELTLEDEDSLTDRFDAKHVGKIDLAVIHYPRISNFTDFDVFEQMPEVSVRYVTNVRELGTPDLIFLPGSKNTMGDLKWMRQNGLEAAVKRVAGKVPIFGICGGYQMLGCEIADPDSVEEGGQIRGMELLPVRTVLQKEKHRCQTDGTLDAVEGIFSGLTGCEFTGYEIHMGQTVFCNRDDGSGAKVQWTRQPDRQTVQKAIGALSVQTMRRETRKSHKRLSLIPPAESMVPIFTVCSTRGRSPGV